MCRFTAIILVLGATVTAFADPPVDYAKQIKPILKERCYACHGALKQEADLRLDTASSILTGGSGGAAVVAGNADGSELVSRISATDDTTRMPPEGAPLKAEEIRQIRQWIQQGASGAPNEVPESNPRDHWAFRQPVRPRPPNAPTGEGARNPIDLFIRERRVAAGIQPLPPTDRATLLRRLYLDLAGLPPTADEVLAFLNDESPAAYETVVERLLESPQHGERWARHWMDVWRYSDWYGRRAVPDVMNSYPMIWRWRDWIVQSVNEDKPYDQMIVEMLAADEVLPADDRNIVATGYLVRSWFKWNYEAWKKDLVEHTGKAFLGLTLNCAQCHDHKYDPIGQEEYFRFRAFFEPLELRHDRVPGEADPGAFVKYVYGQPYGPIRSGMVRVFDENLAAETFMFSKGDSRLRIEGKPPVSPGAPAVLGGHPLRTSPITLPIVSAYPGMKESVRTDERTKRKSGIIAADRELAQAREALASEPLALREELQKAETALVAARAEATRLVSATTPGRAEGGSSGRVLEGTQSLVLDAKVGRRALSHALPGLDAMVENGDVSYLVQIVQDGHTNLQLGLDIAQGATGGFVAFEKGAIRTYAPGGFHEFVAGTYDLAKGQNRFRVQLRLDLAQNQLLLTVTSLADNRVLVDAVPAALNGWRPQANGKRGLFLDCRPGTEAVYDDLCFAQPDGAPVLKFDFEPPGYAEGREVTEALAARGSAPWLATGFCQAPATSRITSAVSEYPLVREALVRVAAAQQALRLPVLGIAAAEARLHAAQLDLASLEQRIEADAARYSTGRLSEDRQAEPAVKALVHSACQGEREAAAASAKATMAAAEASVAAAEVKVAEVKVAEAVKPTNQAAMDAANKVLQAAQQQRTHAANALSSANASLLKELGEYTPLSPKYPQVTTGRRAALARWIANKDNPLTARVAVNHIWLRHFGQALVESPHDLGRNGGRPTHPELLDWLACELMDSGWSTKHIHRLIVTSQTYRLASMTPRSLPVDEDKLASASAADPDNRTYWHFPAARMQAEVVRDSLLAVSGELDRTKGGHEIDHKQGMTSPRRSLYFAHHGEEKMEFLELFDAANACDCYKRTSSVQPQQALALSNSELTKSLSRHLARRLWTQAISEGAKLSANQSTPIASSPSPATGSPVAAAPKSAAPEFASLDAGGRFVRLAFLQVLNREPRQPELAASLAFLEQQAGRLSSANGAAPGLDPDERSRGNLIHVLMNHNDFVTIR